MIELTTKYENLEGFMGKWQRSFFQPNLPLGKDGQRVTACKEHIALSKAAAKEAKGKTKNTH